MFFSGKMKKIMSEVKILKKIKIIISSVIVLALLIAAPLMIYANPYQCKVQSGDTLSSIANRYQISLAELKKCNPQISDANDLKPGQRVNIPDTSNVEDIEKQVIRLVNRERAKHGLQKLTGRRSLCNVARLKSRDMIAKNYFSHQSPTYGSPFNMMENYGIKFSAAGENIAKGQKTAAAVVAAWMNSPGHRANILSKTYNSIGVGVAKTANGTYYWTQLFIKSTK